MTSEGVKHDQDKNRLDLVDPILIEETAKVLTFGAKKYEEYNWAKGILFSRVYRAALGHILAWWQSEEDDPESGLSHLAHPSCCIMFLLRYTYDARGYEEFDDREWVRNEETDSTSP